MTPVLLTRPVSAVEARDLRIGDALDEGRDDLLQVVRLEIGESVVRLLAAHAGEVVSRTLSPRELVLCVAREQLAATA